MKECQHKPYGITLLPQCNNRAGGYGGWDQPDALSASGTNHRLESRLHSSAGAVFPSRQAPIALIPWERSVGIVPLAASRVSLAIFFSFM